MRGGSSLDSVALYFSATVVISKVTEAITVEFTNRVMKVGDRVRVKSSVVVYHHPQHRNEPLDIQGQEGEVFGIASEWKGQAISANFPILVKFEKRFRAHLREDELETV